MWFYGYYICLSWSLNCSLSSWNHVSDHTVPTEESVDKWADSGSNETNVCPQNQESYRTGSAKVPVTHTTTPTGWALMPPSVPAGILSGG